MFHLHLFHVRASVCEVILEMSRYHLGSACSFQELPQNMWAINLIRGSQTACRSLPMMLGDGRSASSQEHPLPQSLNTHTQWGKPSRCHVSSVLRSLMGRAEVDLTGRGQIYCVLTHRREKQKGPHPLPHPPLSHDSEWVTPKNCCGRGLLRAVLFKEGTSPHSPHDEVTISLSHHERLIYVLIKCLNNYFSHQGKSTSLSELKLFPRTCTLH